MNNKLRCIITVPQTIIASGFLDAKLEMPNDEKLHWSPLHNLCEKTPLEGTVNYLITWLQRPFSSLDDGVLICTHATLINAYRRLKQHNHLGLFQNLLLWIDEAHHIKNVSMEDFPEISVSNGIGELVAFCLQDTNQIQIGLTTATFFRGDRSSLLTEIMET